MTSPGPEWLETQGMYHVGEYHECYEFFCNQIEYNGWTEEELAEHAPKIIAGLLQKLVDHGYKPQQVREAYLGNLGAVLVDESELESLEDEWAVEYE